MTNREIEKYVDAFKYWCENEECGVITLPKFICDNIMKILDNALKEQDKRDKEKAFAEYLRERGY